VSNQHIVLVDAHDVLAIQSDGHHTRAYSRSRAHFCNLNIGDLEMRLDPELFARVRPSHFVNLQAVTQLLRDDGRLALQLDRGESKVPASCTRATGVLGRLGVTSWGFSRQDFHARENPAQAQRLRSYSPAAAGALHRRFALLGGIPWQVSRT
jgi:hypothetical protein